MGGERALANAPLGDYILPLGILVQARNVRRFRTQLKATVSAVSRPGAHQQPRCTALAHVALALGEKSRHLCLVDQVSLGSRAPLSRSPCSKQLAPLRSWHYL